MVIFFFTTSCRLCSKWMVSCLLIWETNRFTICYDIIVSIYQALVWLFSLKEPKGRIARWLEILSAFQFSIQHRPGSKHGNADGMSRCPSPEECLCSDAMSTNESHRFK
jgi:hypothetical protein